MEDRELLELAAVAVGFEFYPDEMVSPQGLFCLMATSTGAQEWGFWNPLVNGEDAFLLAVRVQAAFMRDRRTGVYVWGSAGCQRSERHFGKDECLAKASKRALVCAAAEIGRHMLSQREAKAEYLARNAAKN